MKLYLAIVRFLTHPWTGFLFRLIAGAVLVYASYDKLLHPEAFMKIVHNYRILPPALDTVFALTLPWMEFLVGVFLVLGLFTEASALLNCGLLILFLIAIPSALLRHIDINCGCFSTTKSLKVGMDLFYRDILLLIPALFILFFPSRLLAIDSLLTKRKAPSS